MEYANMSLGGKNKKKLTSLGLPYNLRGNKSDSGTTMPGANLSAPRGFDETHICMYLLMQQKSVNRN